MPLIKDIAKKIPDNVRSKILITENDPIFHAKANPDNPEMLTLAKIWYQFIEPNKEFTLCTICLNNILTNFKQMKESLIELENEYQKLKHL